MKRTAAASTFAVSEDGDNTGRSPASGWLPDDMWQIIYTLLGTVSEDKQNNYPLSWLSRLRFARVSRAHHRTVRQEEGSAWHLPLHALYYECRLVSLYSHVVRHKQEAYRLLQRIAAHSGMTMDRLGLQPEHHVNLPATTDGVFTDTTARLAAVFTPAAQIVGLDEFLPKRMHVLKTLCDLIRRGDVAAIRSLRVRDLHRQHVLPYQVAAHNHPRAALYAQLVAKKFVLRAQHAVLLLALEPKRGPTILEKLMKTKHARTMLDIDPLTFIVFAVQLGALGALRWLHRWLMPHYARGHLMYTPDTALHRLSHPLSRSELIVNSGTPYHQLNRQAALRYVLSTPALALKLPRHEWVTCATAFGDLAFYHRCCAHARVTLSVAHLNQHLCTLQLPFASAFYADPAAPFHAGTFWATLGRGDYANAACMWDKRPPDELFTESEWRDRVIRWCDGTQQENAAGHNKLRWFLTVGMNVPWDTHLLLCRLLQVGIMTTPQRADLALYLLPRVVQHLRRDATPARLANLTLILIGRWRALTKLATRAETTAQLETNLMRALIQWSETAAPIMPL